MNSRQKAKTKTELDFTPDEQVPAERSRVWWVVGLASGVLLFVGSTFAVMQGALLTLETRMFHFINTWPENLYRLFFAATIAPESLWIALAAVVVTFLLKMYRAAWELAAATIASYGLVFLGKELIDRARPEGLLHDAIVRIGETGNGFPSGHTMIVTVVVLTLFPYMRKGWRWLPVLLIPAVALSRVYLGVHMPLDVVGGFAIGLAVVCAMRSLPKPLRRWLRFN